MWMVSTQQIQMLGTLTCVRSSQQVCTLFTIILWWKYWRKRLMHFVILLMATWNFQLFIATGIIPECHWTYHLRFRLSSYNSSTYCDHASECLNLCQVKYNWNFYLCTRFSVKPIDLWQPSYCCSVMQPPQNVMQTFKLKTIQMLNMNSGWITGLQLWQFK